MRRGWVNVATGTIVLYRLQLCPLLFTPSQLTVSIEIFQPDTQNKVHSKSLPEIWLKRYLYSGGTPLESRHGH